MANKKKKIDSKGKTVKTIGNSKSRTKKKKLDGKTSQRKSRAIPLIHTISEDKYFAIIDQASDPLFIHDFNGNFVEVNSRACDILGYTREELLKMNVVDLERDFDIKSARKEWEKIKPREYFTLYGRHRKKDGTIFPVEIRMGMFVHNKVKYVLGFTRDISEKRKAEDEIKIREERFRSTLDGMLEGCQIIGFDWKYIYLNKSAEIHNRRPNTELLGKRYTDMWPGIEETEVFKLIKTALERRVTHHFENKFVFPDGKSGWFELSIQPVPEGVFILSVDITQRKKAEFALKENEQQMRFALEGANDGIWDYTIKTDELFLSPRACNILGYEANEIREINKVKLNLIHPDDNPGLIEKITKHLKGKADNFDIEFRLKNKKSNWIWINLKGKISEFDSDKMPYRITGTFTDITQKKKNELALRESREQYFSLFEFSNDAILLSMPDGTVLAANTAACEMFGMTEKEICERGRIGLIDRNDERINDILEGRKRLGYSKGELRFVRKDGTPFESEITTSIYKDKEGNFRTSIIIRDISERKKSQEAIVRSEKKYRYLFDNNPFPMWVYDLDTLKYIDVNESAVVQYGYTREEFLSMTLKDIRPEEDIEALINDVATTNKVVNNAGIWRHKRKNGEVFFVEIVSHLIEFEGRLARLVLAHNVNERVLAEKKLAENETHFRNLADSGKALIWTSGTDKKCDYFNKPWLEFTGKKLEEELGDGWAKGVHPNDLQRCFDVYTGSFDKREKFSIEYRLRHKRGEYRWILDEGCPRYDSAGKFIGYIGYCIDITDRKKAEGKIIESENKFRKIYEEGPFGMVMVGKEHKFSNANKTFCDMIGYSEEELKNLSFMDITHPDDIKKDSENIEKLRKKIIPVYKTEKKYIRKDKTLIWGSLTTVSNFSDKGEFLYNLAIVEDITGRKNSEEKLKINEERFRQVVETSGVWVWEVDNEGLYTYVSRTEEGILGYNVSELIGKKHFYDFFIPEVKEELKSAAFEVFKNKGVFRNFENPNLHKNGDIVYLETSGMPLLDEKGNLIGYRGADRDITEKKLAEKERIKINEELEKRVQERTIQLQELIKELEAFSYSVSHDLRAPLRAISGFSGLLLNDYYEKLDEEGKEYLNDIMRNATKMAKLIDDLLQLARFGRKPVERTNVSMNDLFSSIIEEEKKYYEDKYKFIISDLPEISGDRSLLKQVITNLIANAMKFSSKSENPVIEIGFEENEKEITYFVKDNGVGFDMKFVGKLFGVFQRLHKANEFQGTGVGLAIVQRIVIKHGGRVRADSVPGGGARFSFSLPKN